MVRIKSITVRHFHVNARFNLDDDVIFDIVAYSRVSFA